MSVFTDAVAAVQAALKLSDDVRRASEELKSLALEVRDDDRRITRLEAQWQTALASSRKRLE
jgi:hypothetical protein